MDWGLGHATRCIPIIFQLQQQQLEVIVAAEGKIALILSEAFPGIRIIPLKGYGIQYSGKKSFFLLKILLQIPKILSVIRFERKWLEKTIKQHQIHAVISDNRYGLYSKKIPCVFITHQLHIKTGFGFLDIILQNLNYRFINRFRECWVPDNNGDDNLAGELSHPKKLPSIPLKYIGTLSRFNIAPEPIQYDVAIILSGPEPQRTIFEKLIFNQLKSIEKRVVMVRGLPDATSSIKNNLTNLTIYNHLSADRLSAIMQQSEIVFARSGYSTIMDLVAIQKKSILIPTPGQTEQEYLASYLSKKRISIYANQYNFDIPNLLKRSASFDFSIFPINTANASVISEWIKEVKKN